MDRLSLASISNDQERDGSIADSLGLRLHCLAELLEALAAGAEARRTLGDLAALLDQRPALRDELHANMRSPHDWTELPDMMGESLRFIAGEIQTATGKLVDLAYRQSRATR